MRIIKTGFERNNSTVKAAYKRGVEIGGSLLLLIFLTFALSSCRKDDKEPCIDPDLKSLDMACTEEYAPVCGCNGVTYDNPCIAKFRNGVKFYTPGPCNCTYSHTGTVEDLNSLDGCDTVIRLPDNSRLEIASSPANFKLVPGMTISFDYTIDPSASICMVGPRVNISCIKEGGCESIFDTAAGFMDHIDIMRAYINGDCVFITYAYGGGCHDNHEVRLSQIHPFCGTPPLPPPFLLLEHNGHGDLCNAYITDSASYDLISLQLPGVDSVQFSLNNRSSTYNKQFTYRY